jgi:hypothetical protein
MDDFDQLSNKSQIAENNEKYGRWWVEHLSTKVESVVLNFNKRTVNRKLVRVKVYNSLTYRMEEIFLVDLLIQMFDYCKDSFLVKKEADQKNQVNIWGPYFISHIIYNHLVDTYHK